MDVNFTNEDLNSALKRALVFYLNFLQHTQRNRELSLPHHGKEFETTVDIFTEQGLQSQETATRVCIQYSDRIANNIREWMVGNGDTAENEGRESTALTVGVGDVLDGSSEYMKMERDFIDPFSGKLIQPTTPFSAGPSKDYESGTATHQTSLTDLASGENNNLSFQNDSQPPAKLPVQVIKASPITITVPADEDVISESSTQFYSAVATPQLATPQHSETFLNFTPTSITAIDEDIVMKKPQSSHGTASPITIREAVPDMFSEDIIAALELQVALDAEDEELRHQFQFALTFQNKTVSSTYSAISHWEVHRSEAQGLVVELERDEEDSSFNGEQSTSDLEIVRLLQQEEENRVHEIEREVAEVKWLQELWENEDVEFIQQEELTKETLRVEEEQAMRIRADILLARQAESIWEEEEKAQFEQQEEFAREMFRAEDIARGIQNDVLTAQRAQSQWEREIEEEQVRLDAEEAKRVAARMAEEEKRAWIEKEEMRQEQENIAKELRWKKEGEERERGARQADCASCMEAGERSDMAMLPCKHAYCGECIAGAFKTASSSKKEFKCCGTTVSVQLASRWLDSIFIASYETLLLERSTPNPRYCSNQSCSKFIPPQHIHGPICICPACNTRSCKSCGNGEHAGVCAEDKEGKKVQDLAQQNGWKTCGTCGQILERTEGCLHMTCRCGAHWCYNCLREWSLCNSTCQR